MRYARLIAGVLGLLLGVMPGTAMAGLAVAGPSVRLPVIGTPFSIMLPDRFAAAPDRHGMLTNENVDAMVFGEPNDSQWQVATKATARSPLSSLLFKLLGKLGIGAKMEIVQLADEKFLLQSQSIAKGHYELWRVTPVARPDVSISFVQFDDRQHVLDRDVVLRALSTLRPSREETVKDGVYVGGLFIPARPPFIWTSLTSSREDGGKGAQLAAIGTGTVATLTLAFPWSSVKLSAAGTFDAYLWSMAGQLYEPLTGAVVEDARRTSLAGVDAVRTRISYDGGETIEYVASSGGYPIVMTARRDHSAMAPNLVDTIDEIARSIRPQTQEELAGAQP